MEEVNIVQKDCIYTQCYCEENVWKLCQMLMKKADINHFHVVFISNINKTIPIWCQKSSSNHLQPVVWDYHVILLQEYHTGVQVFDLDSTLNFPCFLKEYAIKALKNEQNMNTAFHRYFRVIPASYYLQTFASDRSHMKNKEGKWLKSPPSYQPIVTQESSMNLFEFLDMSTDNGHGIIMNMNKLLEHFHCHVDWQQPS